MRGQTANQAVLNSILFDETLNFKVKITELTLKSGDVLPTITNAEISQQGGFEYEEAIGSDDSFNVIGSAIASSIKVVLYNENDRYSNYDFEGAECLVYISQSVPTYYARFGKFIVQKATYNENTISLTMLDLLSDLDVPFTYSGTLPITLSSICWRIYAITGRVIYTENLSQLDTDRLNALNTYKIYSLPDFKTTTCRDVLGWIASIIGCYVCAAPIYDRVGHGWYQSVISFRWPGAYNIHDKIVGLTDIYVVDENGALHQDTRFVTNDSGTISEVPNAQVIVDYPVLKSFRNQSIAVSDTAITGVKITVNNLDVSGEEPETTEYLCGTDDFCITIANNPFITHSTAQAVADFVGAKIIGTTFRKCNLQHIGNILVATGDFIYVKDTKNNLHKVLITRTNIKIGSPQTIVCGSEEVETNGKMIVSDSLKRYTETKNTIASLYESIGNIRNELDQQYFWHDETGTHKGSHITEQIRADFVEDPDEGGYNAYFTSSALSLRDGVTDLSKFTNSYVQIGKDEDANIKISPNIILMRDPAENEIFKLRSSANIDGDVTVRYTFTSITLNLTYNATSELALSNLISNEVDLDSYNGFASRTLTVTVTAKTSSSQSDSIVNNTYELYISSTDVSNKTISYTNLSDSSSALNGNWVCRAEMRLKFHRAGFRLRIGTFDDTTVGANSVTIGTNNTSKSGSGIAIGTGISMDTGNSVYVGSYNETESRYKFLVGTGTGDGNRIDGFGISGNSNAYLHFDENATVSSVDGRLTNVLELINDSNLVSYDNMLNIKEILYKLLLNLYNSNIQINNLQTTLNALQTKVNSEKVVHRKYETGEDGNEKYTRDLTIFNDGRIEYHYVSERAFDFNSNWYSNGYYRKSVSYSLPSIIDTGGTYAMVGKPNINIFVNVTGQYSPGPIIEDLDIYDPTTVVVLGEHIDEYGDTYYELGSTHAGMYGLRISRNIYGFWKTNTSA